MQHGAPSAGGARSHAAIAHAAIALATALATYGCDGEVSGEAGGLGFAYSTAEGRIAATTPLAVGSRASVVLESEPGVAFGAIVSAASFDPDTVEVVQTDPNVVIVQALAPGQTEVEITALVGDDGARVSDTLVIETVEVGQVSIARACATADGGPFLTDSRIALPYTMTAADGVKLTGWGFYPIEVAPAGAVELDPQTTATTLLPLATTRYVGAVDLTSTLGGEPMRIDVVGEDEIESAFLEGGEQTNEVIAGSSRDLQVVPIVRDEPVCQGEPEREVEVLTPEVCALGGGGERDAVDRATTVRVEGLTRGVCQIAVRYPRAAAGQGVSVTFALDVI